jgi:hypothetical protein
MMRKARHVVELWQSIGRGKIPRRDDFRLANFPMLAPHLMVASVANQLSDYQVTHAGSAVEQSYGWGLNGLSFARIDLGAVKDEVLEDYEFCATKRVVIVSRHVMTIGADDRVEVQRVLLPFDLALSERVGQVVAWFHLSPMPRLAARGVITEWRREERTLIDASV